MTRAADDTSPRPALRRRLQEIGSLEECAFYLRQKDVRVSGSYLSMIANGTRDPSVAMAKRIADGLGLKLADIVGK